MKKELSGTAEKCRQGVFREYKTRSIAEAEGLPSRRQG